MITKSRKNSKNTFWQVTIPTDERELRKALRALSSETGYSIEETVIELLHEALHYRADASEDPYVVDREAFELEF